jgi:CheY-like chemotaxis protein/two-component sensor histidine kinase
LIAAAQRAAALTRQLLAFSHRQLVQPTILQLNEIVYDIERMLHRVIGEDIELATELWPALGIVRADAGQLQQIVVNLTVNARDAMPKGGRLTITTANVILDESYAASHAGVTPGDFVMLAVSDTGTGMDAETRRHIFEPFFTTKEVGTGTGLGLSTVYGIVQQSGGHIWVESEPGAGTSFKIYFPRAQGLAAVPERQSQRAPASRATGTILLVEDDEAVRRVAVRILRDVGYTVFEAKSASEARRICQERGSSIDLLLTDVVMPDVRGPELARELSLAHPQLRVAYMSGYSGEAVANESAVDAGLPCIEKPFSPASLAERIREILAVSSD